MLWPTTSIRFHWPVAPNLAIRCWCAVNLTPNLTPFLSILSTSISDTPLDRSTKAFTSVSGRGWQKKAIEYLSSTATLFLLSSSSPSIGAPFLTRCNVLLNLAADQNSNKSPTLTKIALGMNGTDTQLLEESVEDAGRTWSPVPAAIEAGEARIDGVGDWNSNVREP